MNSEQIQELTDQEDIPGLCALVDEALQGSAEDQKLLADSISQILEIWTMDFDTQKGGDPNDYPFLDGVQALQTLTQIESRNLTAWYLIQCADYLFEEKNFPQAREKALAAETFLLESKKNHPQDQDLYSSLISLYKNFPSNDLQERESRFVQAIDLAKKALPLSNHYLKTQLDLFYEKNDFPSLEPRLIQERQLWLKNATQAAEQDPILALELSRECLFLIEDIPAQNSLDAQIEQILSLFGELALKGVPRAFQADPTTFAHTFMRLGKILQKEKFFEAAQNLYAGH
jgi:hypothetical protein